MPFQHPFPPPHLAGVPSEPCHLIVGLGNCLMRDDGVGVHAVWELQNDLPPRAFAIDVGMDVFSAVSYLQRASHVLAIDAMNAEGGPGTVYRCAPRELVWDAARKSMHEMALLSALELIAPQQRPEVTVLGIQPDRIEQGFELSSPLKLALPRIIAAARDIVTAWPDQSSRSTPTEGKPLSGSSVPPFPHSSR